MKHYLKKISILFLLLIPMVSMAQKLYNFSGVVENKETKEKVVLVAIQLLELNRWTTSNMQGEFNFDNVPEGAYTIQASCLGFEKYEYPFEINRDITNYTLRMDESSLGLDEILVVAKENTSLSSSSKIENIALQHVQPTNLADVMQLVPGQIALNPDMSGTNQITIRDINTESDPADNDALGTAIIIDGTPIDNDANLQTLNTVTGGTSQGYSSAGQGVDLRQISTDNIESIEVIRGIPSVQYGDLTSGAVVVKTKSGKTPFNAKIKADPNIKQAAISKGFLIPGENNGAINLDFDYTNSLDDLREPAGSFKRLTGQFGYSNTLFKESKPLSINLKAGYFQTIDDYKNDPDQTELEKEKDTETGFDLKLYGKWSIQKWWLGNITYNFSGSYKKQDYYHYRLNTVSATPIPTSYVSGIYEAEILPSFYYSELNIDGKPYNYFASVIMDSRWNLGEVSNKIMYGIDYRVSGNNGKGRIYDLSRPPNGSISTRPRAFNDIPANKKLALFFEDEIIIPLGKTKLTTQLGVRYNNLLPKGLFATKGYTTVEPRLNTAYEIIKNNRKGILRDLTLRFGYGKTSKTPTMLHMNPDKAYFDKISFNYYPELIVVTTQVFDDLSNPDLKPMTNDKIEAGIDFNVKGVKFTITGFKEKIRNGFDWRREFFVMEYQKWIPPGAGYTPVFTDNAITIIENGETQILDYEMEKEFEDLRKPINDYSVDKKGIEYVVNFGQVKQIKTDFLVDGAYYNIKRIDNVIPYYEGENSTYQGDYYPYFGVFAGNKGKINQRFNSNFKTTTHIPDLKMVFTFTMQMIWMDKTQYFWEDMNGTPLAYSRGENNEKLYGQFKGADIIYIDPVGFTDMNMQYHEWQDEYSFLAPYSSMVSKKDEDFYDTEAYPINWQLNLKLTKEFGKFARLSFFANNLFNHRPLYKYKRSGHYTRLNQTAYFGAELTFSF